MNPRFATASLLALTALVSTACKSSDQGATTGTTITTASEQLAKAATQLDATVASLHSIVETPAADLTVQRSAFEDSLDDLESTIKSMHSTSADMTTNGDLFLAEWDNRIRTIQNEDIREKSEDRRKAVEAGFTKAKKKYGECKTELEPIMRDLSDIRTALKSDLTMHGIDALKPEVKRISKDSKSVSEDLRELSKQFSDVAVEFNRNGPPPPEAK
jgi:predicted  nucleic acid-binding Zn-ribbon protein